MRLLISALIAASLTTAPTLVLASNGGLNSHIDATIADANRMLSRDERAPEAWGFTQPADVKVWKQVSKRISTMRPAVVQREGRIVTIRSGPEEVVFELVNVEKGLFKFGSHTLDISKVKDLTELRRALAELPQFKGLDLESQAGISLGFSKAYASPTVVIGLIVLALLALFAGPFGSFLSKTQILAACNMAKSTAGAGPISLSDATIRAAVKELKKHTKALQSCSNPDFKSENIAKYNEYDCDKIRSLTSCLAEVDRTNRSALTDLGIAIEGNFSSPTVRFLNPSAPASTGKSGGLF